MTASRFPDDQPPAPPVPVSCRLPAALVQQIDYDAAGLKQTRSERIAYLLEYAHQAGTLNQFVDIMKAQYLEIMSVTPEQIAAGASTYNQVENLTDRVNDIDDKLQSIIKLLQQKNG